MQAYQPSDDAVLAEAVITFDVTVAAPAKLMYPEEHFTFTIGDQVSIPAPKLVGSSATSFTIAPSVIIQKLGLVFDDKTGAISGQLADITALGNNFTVTAFNNGGSVSADIVIDVVDVRPTSINYDYSHMNLVLGEEVLNHAFYFGGGAITNFSISPPLPKGLRIDQWNGRISGAPVVEQPLIKYDVLGANTGGYVHGYVYIQVELAKRAPLHFFEMGSNPSAFKCGQCRDCDAHLQRGEGYRTNEDLAQLQEEAASTMFGAAYDKLTPAQQVHVIEHVGRATTKEQQLADCVCTQCAFSSLSQLLTASGRNLTDVDMSQVAITGVEPSRTPLTNVVFRYAAGRGGLLTAEGNVTVFGQVSSFALVIAQVGSMESTPGDNSSTPFLVGLNIIVPDVSIGTALESIGVFNRLQALNVSDAFLYDFQGTTTIRWMSHPSNADVETVLLQLPSVAAMPKGARRVRKGLVVFSESQLNPLTNHLMLALVVRAMNGLVLQTSIVFKSDFTFYLSIPIIGVSINKKLPIESGSLMLGDAWGLRPADLPVPNPRLPVPTTQTSSKYLKFIPPALTAQYGLTAQYQAGLYFGIQGTMKMPIVKGTKLPMEVLVNFLQYPTARLTAATRYFSRWLKAFDLPRGLVSNLRANFLFESYNAPINAIESSGLLGFGDPHGFHYIVGAAYVTADWSRSPARHYAQVEFREEFLPYFFQALGGPFYQVTPGFLMGLKVRHDDSVNHPLNIL